MSVLFEVPFYYKISIFDIINHIFDITTSIFLISQNELEILNHGIDFVMSQIQDDFLISQNRICFITKCLKFSIEEMMSLRQKIA